MALVIYASIDHETGLEVYKQRLEDSVYFHGDEGYYWHLLDAFKDIEKETGHMIELYDGALFEGSNLRVLIDRLEQELQKVDSLPQELEVEIGKRMSGESVYHTINRLSLSKILDKFIYIARSAEDSNEIVVCWGD
jgi:hypothetical protein